MPTGTEIAIEVAVGDSVLLIEQSKTGTYFCIAQVPGSPLTSRGQRHDLHGRRHDRGVHAGLVTPLSA